MSQHKSGSEILELAEGVKRGAELRLMEIETQGRSRWDRETESLHKLHSSQIIEGIRKKGLQEVNFSVTPSRYGENLLKDQDNRVSVLQQIKGKQIRQEITGRDLIERIDKETSFLKSSISNERQINNLKISQEIFNKLVKSKLPEKDIAGVVKERISELKKARTDLQGLESNSFTLPRNDIYSTIKNHEFKQKVEKLNEIQLTGSELTKRIDGELKYFREAVNSPEKRDRLRSTQTAYKTIPEKDIITIIEEKVNNMELARMKLKGLEKATFTINKRDNIHSIVKSPDLAKQIRFENGRFRSRDR